MVTAEAGAVAEWFWAVTLQWIAPGDSGFVMNTVHGTAVIPVSATRRDAYEGVMAQARQRAGIPAGTGANVIFLLLEPSSLTTGGPS